MKSVFKRLESHLDNLTIPLIYPAILGSLIYELIQSDTHGKPTIASIGLWAIVALYCLDYLVLRALPPNGDILRHLSDILAALSFKSSSIYVLSGNFDCSLFCLAVVSLTLGVVVWRMEFQPKKTWFWLPVVVPIAAILLSSIFSRFDFLRHFLPTELGLFLFVCAYIGVFYVITLLKLGDIDRSGSASTK